MMKTFERIRIFSSRAEPGVEVMVSDDASVIYNGRLGVVLGNGHRKSEWITLSFKKTTTSKVNIVVKNAQLCIHLLCFE